MQTFTGEKLRSVAEPKAGITGISGNLFDKLIKAAMAVRPQA